MWTTRYCNLDVLMRKKYRGGKKRVCFSIGNSLGIAVRRAFGSGSCDRTPASRERYPSLTESRLLLGSYLYRRPARFPERCLAFTPYSLFFGSVRCNRSAVVSWERKFLPTREGLISGKKNEMEKLWRDFFTDPSRWWDHRSEKINPKFPDFKHKQTREALWLDSKWNPPWVASEITLLAPETLQLNVFAWTQRLIRYNKAEEYEKTMQLFEDMEQDGIEADHFVFVHVLNACAGLQVLEEGKRIHGQIIGAGCESDPYVGNSLVDMYSKCGSIEDAWSVFKKMPSHNVIGWTAMISGYVKCGQGLQALKLFRKMQQEGIQPNSVTLVQLLNACASVAALEEGRFVHDQIIWSGYESDKFVGSSLIDMYAKCGSIEDAWRVFNKMPIPSVAAWNAMIGGYAMHGLATEALVLFEQMSSERVNVNEVTFVCLLSACSHGGQVDEGIHYFESMSSIYGIIPLMEHYTCIIDLLGRAGRLADAKELVKTMSLEPAASVWRALLGACRIHGNVELGECVAEHVQELDPNNASGHVLISNMYAAAGLWDSSTSAQQQRLERGVRKQPGCM